MDKKTSSELVQFISLAWITVSLQPYKQMSIYNIRRFVNNLQSFTQKTEIIHALKLTTKFFSCDKVIRHTYNSVAWPNNIIPRDKHKLPTHTIMV